MKRFLSALLTLALSIAMLAPSAAFAVDAPSVSTPRICLMDAATGAVLYEKSARDQAYPASTTKIMTCILALENCPDLSEVVNVGESFDTRGSLMGFVRNEELRVMDLIYGTMLVSGNDAASALAIHISGSQDAFAELMNAKAAELGMTGTHFVKSNGLHKDDHYTTAYDMALLASYAMQNQTFRDIVSAETFNVPPSEWDSDGYALENSNKLIHTKADDTTNYRYEYATGIKTGDTDQAGRCLVASAQKNNVELILVLFGDPQGDAGKYMRFENAPKFFDWGFDNYASVSASELGLEATVTVPVSNGAFGENANGLTATADIAGKIVAGTKDYVNGIIAAKDSITYTCAYPDGADSLTAPIAAGDDIGTITYSCNGAAILTAPLTAANSVDEIGNIIEANPSASPLLADDAAEGNGSPWLFWILIAVALISILLIIRIIAVRNSRKRRRSRRARSRSRRFR